MNINVDCLSMIDILVEKKDGKWVAENGFVFPGEAEKEITINNVVFKLVSVELNEASHEWWHYSRK